MPITPSTTYSLACDHAGCTNTWSGTELNQATGWVQTFGSWQVGAPQPMAMQVFCPTHA